MTNTYHDMIIDDKINQELDSLKNELGRLKHYTLEIENASYASGQVVGAVLRFVKSNTDKVDAITNSLKDSSNSFKASTSTSAEQLGLAVDEFKNGVLRSTGELHHLVKDLQSKSNMVKSMIDKIEAINFPERLQENRDTLIGISQQVCKLEESMEKMVSSLSEVAEQFQSGLSVILKQIHTFSESIEEMKIPEQFRKAHESLQTLERQVNLQGTDLSARFTAMEGRLAETSAKVNGVKSGVTLTQVLLVLQLILSGVLLYRIFVVL